MQRDSCDDRMDTLYRAGHGRYSTCGNSKSSINLNIFTPAEKSHLPLILTVSAYFINPTSKLPVHFSVKIIIIKKNIQDNILPNSVCILGISKFTRIILTCD